MTHEELTRTSEEIDAWVAVLQDAVKVATVFYPPLAVAQFGVSTWLNLEAHKLKAGLASGTIIPDGVGGLVPASNSHYNPRTGQFL